MGSHFETIPAGGTVIAGDSFARMPRGATELKPENDVRQQDCFTPPLQIAGLEGDPFPDLPTTLKCDKRWVTWRRKKEGERVTKVPFNPVTGAKARVTDGTFWVDYQTAVRWMADYDGIGYVIGPPYTVIDLDKCRDPETGVIEPWASSIIDEVNSYSELSPSGTGVHIWTESILPPEGRRKGHIEMYDGARYMTVTGKHLPGTPLSIERRDPRSLHARMTAGELEGDPERPEPAPEPEAQQDDRQSLFGRLMAGKWRGLYKSQSEADLALCVLLVRKFGCDAEKIDSEFRRSGLFRAKWERGDYAERTIRKAIAEVRGRPESGRKGSRLVLERFSEIMIRAIVWLWLHRIPKGKLTVFCGPPDVGKSTVACDVVARYTTGKDWPDHSVNAVEPGEVLMLIAEDDVQDTVKPRLEAAGADMSRVHLVKAVCDVSARDERMIALDKDLPLLKEALRENPRIGLIVIDPVTSYMGQTDLNKEQEVRRLLVPLKELCEESGVTLIAIVHPNKRTDVEALQRVSGAVAMAGVPRAVWLFSKNAKQQGEYLMAPGKNNLTRNRTGLRYRFATKAVPIAGEAPFIAWQGAASESDCDEVLNTAAKPFVRRQEKATEFLRQFLAHGKRTLEDVEGGADEIGISRSALYEARRALGIVTSHVAGEAWWELPEPA